MGDRSLTSGRLYSTLLILKLSQDLWMTNRQLTLTSCGFKVWIQMLRFDSLCLKPLTAVPIFKQGWKTAIFWNSLASPTPPLSPAPSPFIRDITMLVCLSPSVHCCSGTSGLQLETPTLPSCCVEASQYRSGIRWLTKQLPSLNCLVLAFAPFAMAHPSSSDHVFVFLGNIQWCGWPRMGQGRATGVPAAPRSAVRLPAPRLFSCGNQTTCRCPAQLLHQPATRQEPQGL